jgi:hypothetical protein
VLTAHYLFLVTLHGSYVNALIVGLVWALVKMEVPVKVIIAKQEQSVIAFIVVSQ